MAFDDTQNPNLIAIGTRAALRLDAPQPELDTAGAHAYAAQSKGGDNSSDLMALLCDKGVVPRSDVIPSLRNVDHAGLLRLVDSGVIHIPSLNTHAFAFAFQRPAAPRMKTSIDDPHAALSDDFVHHYFITPMIAALGELERLGITHNAIRPTNIFWRIGSATPPQLGDFLSEPPGFSQPVMFETLERAMCSPIGRGAGVHADDCFAFGVTLALLILGQNPLQGMSDDDILRLRIEKGSFAAFIGNRRISPAHIEILRGLLVDDARQRWSANDLEQWLNGRRLTPKNTDTGRRASRAFDFGGKEYWQARSLAHALAKNPQEAAPIIEGGNLDKWLRRALGDETRAENLASAQSSLKASGKTANYEDQLVARACMALDPPAPIRYRGLTVMPMGIATMIVDAMMTGNHAQSLAEIISSHLVGLWVEMQQDSKIELVPLGQQLERMKSIIEKTSFGNGIERVAYELNPGLHCLSPIVRSHYVTTPKMFLPAMERIAGAGDRPREPMDRHIAAFLIVRDRRSEMLFEAMNAPEGSMRRGIALLTLYSDMQGKHGPDSLPALARWLAPMVEMAMQRFLGKDVREHVRTQMKSAIDRGNLSAMLRLVDDPRILERDRQEFMAARMLYLSTLKEIASLEYRLDNRDIVIRETGKPLAASISTFIAIVLVFAAILRALWQAMS